MYWFSQLSGRVGNLPFADSLRLEAARNMGISVAIKVGSMVAGILMQLILVRFLGLEEFGLYTYVWAIFLTLAILTTFGFELSAIRFVAQYRMKGDWESLRGFVQFSRLFLCSFGCIASLTIAAVLFWFPPSSRLNPELRTTLLAVLPLLPIYALLGLHNGILRGGDSLARALLVVNVLFPCLIIATVGGCLLISIPPSSLVIVALSAISLVLLITLQWVWIRNALPPETWTTPARYSPRKWVRVSWSMLLNTAAAQLGRQLGILAVGTFVGTTADGIYGVAVRFARLINLGLQISNQSTAHMYTPLFVNNDHDGLQRVVSFTALVTALTTIPFVLLLVIWPESVLGWFGESFSSEGALILQLLLFGQFVNAISGPNGVVLQMTNHERGMARISIGALVAELIVLAFLIPMFGVVGVALAFSMEVVFRNLAATWYAKKHLAVNTTIFTRHILPAGVSQ